MLRAAGDFQILHWVCKQRYIGYSFSLMNGNFYVCGFLFMVGLL